MERGDEQGGLSEEKNGSLVWTPLTAADSFVGRSNKSIDFSGNGESRLYLGPKSAADGFFPPEDVVFEVALSVQNLKAFMKASQAAYFLRRHEYRGATALPGLWQERMDSLDKLGDSPRVAVRRRGYRTTETRSYLSAVEPGGANWELLRELPLSRTAEYVFTRESVGARAIGYRLWLHPTGALLSSDMIGWSEGWVPDDAVGDLEPSTASQAVVEVRKGQQRFRSDLLNRMPMCPFTGISDAFLLRASHIKPWRDAASQERLDPVNGLSLTPTFDHLFDRGYLTFHPNGHVQVASGLSRETLRALRLVDDAQVLPTAIAQESAEYLQYHRDVVFLG